MRTITHTFSLFILSLLLCQCSPKTSTDLSNDSETTEQTKEIEFVVEDTQKAEEIDKEKLKEELKAELKEELKAEMEAEKAAKEKMEESANNKVADFTALPKVDLAWAKKAVIGHMWDWKETSTPVRGVGTSKTTPQSKGLTQVCIFRSDGTVEISINKYKAATYTYTITESMGDLFIAFTSDNGNTSLMSSGPFSISDTEFRILGNYNDRGGNMIFKKL